MTTQKDKSMQVYLTTQKEYTVREETLKGKTYVVVPVTMMVEGVHQGSHGALLHTAEELGKIPASWNGIPVTIGHPTVEGTPVSANSPEILEEWSLGIVFNTIMNSNKLKSEAWLEKDKLETNENLNSRISNGEIIEVSVGVFSEDEVAEGTWNNEQYVAIAKNLRPDHLAILPNQTGACSIADGCGIRTNQNTKIMDVSKTINELKQAGYFIPSIVVNSEKGMMETIDALRELVRTKNVSSSETSDNYKYCYLVEVFDSYLIYEESTSSGYAYYKQNYQSNVSTKAFEFVGEPVEVERKVEYETVQTNNDTGIKRQRKSNLKKEEIMANEKCTPCIAKKVGELIANASTHFVEEDRAWLETLEEAQLDKMTPKASQKETITPEMAVNALKLNAEEDYIKLMPEPMQGQFRSALKVFADRKASLIDSIITNTEAGTWTKEELQDYQVEKLEKIAKTAGTKENLQANNFTVFGAGSTSLQNNVNVPLLEPAGITFETK
jgi:hypothetical protein